MAQYLEPAASPPLDPKGGKGSAERSAYALGVFFIIAVAIIWAMSSILVQYIYCDMDFSSPFFLTFVSTSLFSVYLPLHYLRGGFTSPSGGSGGGGMYHDVNVNADDDSYPDQFSVPSASDDDSPLTLRPPSMGGGIDDDDDDDDDDNGDSRPPPGPLSTRETFVIACYLAPLWFVANFLYNISLSMTSVTSSTIMSTTGSLFTFGFSLCFASEKFSYSKLMGVLLCFGGSVIVGLNDSKGNGSLPEYDENGTSDQPNKCGQFIDKREVNERSALGDFVGLMGAAGYGAYTVMLRVKVPSDDQISMVLLFGFIGLINTVAIGPILFLLWAFGSVDLTALTTAIMGMLLLKGLFDDVISDYLWARSVVLTSPTVATVGLGLTIPFAFCSDFLINGIVPSFLEVAGAVGVIIGFVTVNL